MLGNIQPKFRSKLKGIKLVGLCKQKHVKKYGMNKILQRLIDDIKTLVSEYSCIQNLLLLHSIHHAMGKFGK